MTDVVRLAETDVALLRRRFEVHGNSFRTMLDALDASAEAERLRALRRLERRLALDLGELCARLAAAEDAHPLEQRLLRFLACWSESEDGGRELWVYPERVRELRTLMREGRLVGEPDG